MILLKLGFCNWNNKRHIRINAETQYFGKCEYIWNCLSSCSVQFFMANLHIKRLTFLYIGFWYGKNLITTDWIYTFWSMKSLSENKIIQIFRLHWFTRPNIYVSWQLRGLHSVLIVGIWFWPLCFGIFLYVTFPPVFLETRASPSVPLTFLLLYNGCLLIHASKTHRKS